MTLRISEDYIGLRYTSPMNEWIDFTVIALKSLQTDVENTIREVMDDFWERDNAMGYGDMLEYALPGETIIYHDDEEDEDAEYDALLENIEWVAIN